MKRRQRRRPRPTWPADARLLAIVLATAAGVVNCTDDEPSQPSAAQEPLPTGLAISEPVRAGGAGIGLVYVSASPGTFPNGESASVTTLANGESATTSIEDGGFDPSAIQASPDDELEILITNRDGTTTAVRAIVPQRKSPRVVRTWPVDGRPDMVVDSTAGAIFSEPLDRRTIIPQTIGLLLDGHGVRGTLRLSGDGLEAEFRPFELLEPRTAYTLAIATGVRDLAGDSLEATVEVRFSTAAIGISFAPLSAGGRHTCGISSDGQLFCWGDDRYGQLGNGGSTTETCADANGEWPCSTRPLLVPGGLTFVSVSASGRHTCGVGNNGEAYCWGDNRYGQLGNGSTTNRESPAPISSELPFSAISAASDHTCGITIDGYAYCWGLDLSGALGNDGSTTETCADPNGEWPCSTRPLPVTGGLTFTWITTGSDHTCGVTADDVAYCWGDNEDGQLGIGTFDNTVPRVPLGVAGGLTFGWIDAGGSHTCGITTEGDTYCWGEDFTGSLGNGTGPTSGTSAAPARVVGGHAFSTVDAGPNHTCAVTTGGDAYCWGSNFRGQLGDGSTDGERAPVPVVGGLIFASISAGFHTCGVTTSAEAYCWGWNSYGQLGNGTTTDTAAPVRVLGLP